MSASEGKADVFRFNFGSLRLNVRFSPKRTLLLQRNSNFQVPLAARSGHGQPNLNVTDYANDLLNFASFVPACMAGALELGSVVGNDRRLICTPYFQQFRKICITRFIGLNSSFFGRKQGRYTWAVARTVAAPV